MRLREAASRNFRTQEAAMTRLAGEFQTDLQMTETLAACAEAVHGLGWRIETVEGSRIVSYPNGNAASPRIELGLSNSGNSTTIRITGSDTDEAPLEEEALISELDRVRDAVEESVDEATASANGAPGKTDEAGPDTAAAETAEEPKEADEPTGAEESKEAEELKGAEEPTETEEPTGIEEPKEAEVEEAKAPEEAKPSDEADEVKASAKPEQAVEPEQAESEQAAEPVDAAADDDADSGDGAALPPPGWYPDPEGSDERFWDGEQWTQRFRSAQREAAEEAPAEEERTEPEPEPVEQPAAVEARPAPVDGRQTSKDMLWGLSLALGAVGGSAAAFSVPDTAFYMPLCFGIAGLALAIAAFTMPGKTQWWAIVAVVASIGGIAIGVHKYSNYQDTKDQISQAQQTLQDLKPPRR
jgi:chemotaxis protein histidine kinase CheA